MHKAAVSAATTIIAGAAWALAARWATAQPAATATSGTDLSTGWSLVKEGDAEGTIEQDATHPPSTSPHLLRISVTRTAAPGRGRAGATSDKEIAVQQGEWFDVTFSATTERGSIGLVFSLEGPQGKVLARTTLPEIGRGGGGGRGRGRAGAPGAAAGDAAAPAPWPKYLVSLHARDTEPRAHLVITPIEPTTLWLDAMTITPRPAAQ